MRLYTTVLSVLVLLGCADPYEDCVIKKQDAYRESNPKADYAKASSANEKFRKECQHLKNK